MQLEAWDCCKISRVTYIGDGPVFRFSEKCDAEICMWTDLLVYFTTLFQVQNCIRSNEMKSNNNHVW